MDASRHAFGPFVFHAESLSLTREGQTVVLGQHALTLLKVLLAAKGEIVSRDRLLEDGWRGAIVGEANLTVQIGSLRKVLGTAPDGQDWIVTVPRYGYRLRQGELSGPSDLDRRRWLAVLPFDNMSGDPAQDYFVDGIVEDMTTILSRTKSIAVVSRTSTFAYKGRSVDARQIGHDLKVDYILEGSIRRSGGRLRVTTQLVETSAGSHVWARYFDCSENDAFDVQDEIVEQVAFAVAPQIRLVEIQRARRKRPDSLDVYDLSLRAFALYWSGGRRNSDDAYRLLEQALALDPTYAPALVCAAQILSIRHSWGWDSLNEAEAAHCLDLCSRAIIAAPEDAGILSIAAQSFIEVGRQYDVARSLVEAALALNPTNIVVQGTASLLEWKCGTLERAAEHARLNDRMMTRGDLNFQFSRLSFARVALMNRDFEQAAQFAEQAMAFNPKVDCAYWFLIPARAFLQQMDEAHRLLAIYRRMSPTVTVAKLRIGQPNKFPERHALIFRGLLLAGLPEN